MDEELQELDQDAGALLPTVLAILTAAAAYGAAESAAKDYATALSIPARIGGALTAAAIRILMKLAQSPKLSKAKREAIMDNMAVAAEKAAADGVTVLAQAAGAVAGNVRKALAAEREDGASPGGAAPGKGLLVSPPGKPFREDLPGDSDEPAIVAQRVASAVRNGARFYVAEEIERVTPPETVEKVKLRKTWHSKKDSRVRASHAFLGDKSYEYHTVDVGSPFISITGAKLRFPGDPKAPLHEIARCRCFMTVR